MRLETERLILRSPTLTDADDIVDAIGDLEVSRHLLPAPYPYAREDAIWWINTTLETPMDEKPTGRDFLVVLKSEQRVIGGIAFILSTGMSGQDAWGFGLPESIGGKVSSRKRRVHYCVGLSWNWVSTESKPMSLLKTQPPTL